MVGARLGSNAEVGFLRGRGEIDGDSPLDLDLVDDSETPGKDDVVVTWGSRSGAPYVTGVPIGTVGSVFSSPREQAKHAVIDTLRRLLLPRPRRRGRRRRHPGRPSGDPRRRDRPAADRRTTDARRACRPLRRGAAARGGAADRVLPLLHLDGVAPNVVLLVVVAAALTRGPEFAAVLGFFGGLRSTSAPRPTTSPAAGPSPSWWWATSPAGCAPRPAARPWRPWPPSAAPRSSAPRSSRSPACC